MDGTTRIGRYEVVDKLPEGGMGVLYLARDTSLGRPVAVKVLAVVNEELKERFAREARAAASLKHQNIVTIYDIGEDNGRPYIAMEFVDGETLADVIRRRKPVPLVQKLRWMLELCAGLGYAHRKGVIHRDIKPGNLMITSDGVLKILDFGLARITAENATALTHAGAVLGTPNYMSPEQIEGRPLDARSDIFAVGLVLYELVGYRKAYSGEAWQAVLLKILQSEPPPLHTFADDLDPAVDTIVSRCIGKNPDDRYPDLAALAEDVRGVLRRLHAGMNEPTLHLDLLQADKGSPGSDSGARASTPTPSHRPNREAIARRRKEQVEKHLAAAAREFDSGNLEATIEQCEMAIVLDPGDLRALALLDQAHRAAEDRKVKDWLSQAETHLAARSLTLASHFVQQALELQPESEDALRLERQLREIRADTERQAERARGARSAVERGMASLAEGAFEAALRSADEALACDPTSGEARALKDRAAAALDEARHRAEAAAEQAREQARLDALAATERQRLTHEETRILQARPAARADASADDVHGAQERTTPGSNVADVTRHEPRATRAPDAPRKRVPWGWTAAAGVALVAALGWYAWHPAEPAAGHGNTSASAAPSQRPAGTLVPPAATQNLDERAPANGDARSSGSDTPAPTSPGSRAAGAGGAALSASGTDTERTIAPPSTRTQATPASTRSDGTETGARGGTAMPSGGAPGSRPAVVPPSQAPAGSSSPTSTSPRTENSASIAGAGDAGRAAASRADVPPAPERTPEPPVERTPVPPPPSPPPATPAAARPDVTPAAAAVAPDAGTRPTSGSAPPLDQQTIQQLLRDYAGLAGRFNVNGLRDVYPRLSSAARLRLDTLRQNYSQCEYRFSNMQTTVVTPTTVTVRADAVESCKPKTAQRSMEITSRYEFHLARQPNGRWIFDDVFFQ